MFGYRAFGAAGMALALVATVVCAFIAAVLSLAWPGAARAYDPPSGQVDYAIEHSKYGRIGTHSLSFSRWGDDLVVDVESTVKVKILFITVHSESASRRETWREGQLVAYRSHTDENGTLFDVAAHVVNGGLVIDGPAGRALADGEVYPTNPWNPEIVESLQEMDTKTGELLAVSVAPAGGEAIMVAGKPVQTSKYDVSGDIERELWFDAAGNWIRLRFPKDGETLTLTRLTPLE